MVTTWPWSSQTTPVPLPSGTTAPLFIACPESTVRSTTLTTERVERSKRDTVPCSSAVSAGELDTAGVTSASVGSTSDADAGRTGASAADASDASTSRLRGCVGDAPPSRTAGASPSRATRRIVRSARLARSGRARGARRGATAVRTAEATTIGARWREERRGRSGSSRNDARRRVDPRPRARSVTTNTIFRTVRRKRKRNWSRVSRGPRFGNNEFESPFLWLFSHNFANPAAGRPTSGRISHYRP